MALTLVMPPSGEPVSVPDCLYRLRIDPTVGESNDVAQLITAARQEIDGANGWLGRAILTQTWDLRLDRFPCGAITLPLPPLQGVTSVKYLDTAGVEQTLAPTAYRVVSRGDWLSLVEPAYGTSWPSTHEVADAVTVRFVAGWPSAAAVPGLIKTWIIARVGGWYAQREDVLMGVTATPAPNIQHMLSPLRVSWVG